MELYVLRHGIAIERDDPRCPPDPERTLTAKGVIRTRRACRGLRHAGVRPQVIITSPYLRALETAEIAADELALPARELVQSEALLPDADPSEIVDVVAGLGLGEVMIVGHAPNLDLVVAHAVGLDAPFTSLKKAGVARVSFPGPAGREGCLTALWEPRMLRLLRRLAED